MNEKQLQDLLRRSDGLATAPRPVPIDVPVLRQRIRRHRRVQAGCVTGLVLVLAGTFSLGRMGVSPRPEESRRVVHLEAEVARLRADTQALLTRVTDLTARQHEENQLTQVRHLIQKVPLPQQQASDLVNQAALILVQRADTLWEQPEERDTARELYSQTIRLYPDSTAAQTARRRLEFRDVYKSRKTI